MNAARCYSTHFFCVIPLGNLSAASGLHLIPEKAGQKDKVVWTTESRPQGEAQSAKSIHSVQYPYGWPIKSSMTDKYRRQAGEGVLEYKSLSEPFVISPGS